MARTEIVVARCWESLKWLDAVREKTDAKITIYNKGRQLKDAIPLPNIGREAHTYLFHIISRYCSLAEHTVFTQGNPADHARIERIVWCLLHPSNNYARISWHRAMDTRTGCLFHKLPIGEFYKALFQSPECPSFYPTDIGAIFMVSKCNIAKHNLEFYERALKMTLQWHEGPWLMERMWPFMFDDIR